MPDHLPAHPYNVDILQIYQEKEVVDEAEQTTWGQTPKLTFKNCDVLRQDVDRRFE